MDYKRRLGHRVLPRVDFLSRLSERRGVFRLPASEAASLRGGREETGIPIFLGARVELHGLSHSELNGRNAVVMRGLKSGRFVVRLIGENREVSLSPERLRRAAGVTNAEFSVLADGSEIGLQELL